jgi:hypothetical protein
MGQCHQKRGDIKGIVVKRWITLVSPACLSSAHSSLTCLAQSAPALALAATQPLSSPHYRVRHLGSCKPVTCMFIYYPLLRVTGPSPAFPLTFPFCQGFVTLGARQQDFLLGTNCHSSSHPVPTGHLALWHLPRVATVLPAALLTSMEGTPPPLPHVAHEV